MLPGSTGDCSSEPVLRIAADEHAGGGDLAAPQCPM
jgi:hypothetical protein